MTINILINQIPLSQVMPESNKEDHADETTDKEEESESSPDSKDDDFDTTNHTFPHIIKDLFMGIPWKLMFMLFMILMVFNNNYFIERVLGRVGNGKLLSGDDQLNNSGTLVLHITIIIAFMILYLLSKGGVL